MKNKIVTAISALALIIGMVTLQSCFEERRPVYAPYGYGPSYAYPAYGYAPEYIYPGHPYVQPNHEEHEEHEHEEREAHRPIVRGHEGNDRD